MKHWLSIILIISAILYGCNDVGNHIEKVSLEEVNPAPIDSFKVSGIDIGQQVIDFEYINDSLLCSYNLIDRDLVYFKRNGKADYHAISHHLIDTEPWGSHVIGNNGFNYFISRENRLITYDEKADKKISDKPIFHMFEHIRDSFMILSSHDAPVILQHDTLITSYGYNSPQSYKHYFEEPAMAEFKIKKDSVVLINNYMPKPKGLENYYLPIGKSCFHNGTFFRVYPCYDTIYTFNRNNHTSSKICIHNKDYKLPEHYDNSKVFTPEYGSYLTKYCLENFQYAAIYYNEMSHHFVLFYFPPVDEKFKDRMATPEDQKMKAIILNDSLEVIAYDIFDIKGYVEPNSYFYIPNKGFAIPTVKSTEDFETTKFYIYNL